jgi:hypothetical protein
MNLSKIDCYRSINLYFLTMNSFEEMGESIFSLLDIKIFMLSYKESISI